MELLRPAKDPLCVGGCQLGEFRERQPARFGQHLGRLLHEGGFVPLAAMRRGRQVRAVGLHKYAVSRDGGGQ